MKKILAILLFLACAMGASAQDVTGNVRFTGTLGIPSDTLLPPAGKRNMMHFASKGASLYVWDVGTQKWILFSSGGGGSTYFSGYGLNLFTFTFAVDTSGSIPSKLRLAKALDSLHTLLTYSNGYGILPLTGNVIQVDSFALATKPWVKKAVDSLKTTIGAPTLQQVLTSGNTATLPMTVNGITNSGDYFTSTRNITTSAGTVSGAILTFGTQLTSPGVFDLTNTYSRYYQSPGGNSVTINSPSGLSGNVILNWPGASGTFALTSQTMPTGGTTGQVLTKNTSSSYDVSWQTPSGGSGATGPATFIGTVRKATYVDTFFYWRNDSTLLSRAYRFSSGSNKVVITRPTADNTDSTGGLQWDIAEGNLSLQNIGGSLAFNQIGQNSATTGQVIQWNGSAWVPATVSGGGGTTYTFQYSLLNTAGVVNLTGDVSAPGNSMLYGTNASGVRGWYAIPAGATTPTLDQVIVAGGTSTHNIVIGDATATHLPLQINGSDKGVTIFGSGFNMQINSGGIGTSGDFSSYAFGKVQFESIGLTNKVIFMPNSVSTLVLSRNTGDYNAAVTGTMSVSDQLRIAQLSADPSTVLANGSVYYNTTNNKFRAYQNGAWVDMIFGGGGVTSVGASVTASTALSIAGSPITTSGTLAFTWTGSSSSYVQGDGAVVTKDWLSSNTNSTQAGYFSTIKLKDFLNPSNYLTIRWNEDETASDRTLDIVMGGASRQLTMTGNASLSGTNTGDQTITLTGPVTGSGTGSFATSVTANAITNAMLAQMAALSVKANPTNATANGSDLVASSDNTVLMRSGTALVFASVGTSQIAASAVTLSKMENRATQTFIGRNTTGTGAPEELSIATAKAMLGLTGTNSGDQTITLTGDVTGSGTGSFATAIGANKVTNAMLAQSAAHTYRGNNTGSTANVADITTTQLTADLNLFTSSLQGLVPSSGGGTTNFLRADGTWAAPPTVTGLADPGANGIVARTAAGATSARTITGSTGDIVVTNGDGVSGNPVISKGANIVDITHSYTYSAGATQNFNASGVVAGLNIGTNSGDPSTVNNADIWYNSGLGALRFRANGASWSAGSDGLIAIASAVSGITTTETIIVQKTISAGTMQAGQTYRISGYGSCTSTAAGNNSNIRVRLGTAGTTSDAAIAVVTPSSASTGNTVPFHFSFLVTIRTTGSGTGTAAGEGQIVNNGTTGISTVATVVGSLGTQGTLNTTVDNVISLTYVSAASTTSASFQLASIAIEKM